MFGRKAVIAMATGILGLGLLGGAAFAAFAPAATDTFSLVPDLSGSALTAAAPKPGNDKLKNVLDALVAKGVITQAQEDSILAAVKGDADRDSLLRRVFAGLFDQSATYLVMKPADLRTKLPGTSLALIANATTGKNRDGLVAALTKTANEAIAKALADGKITKDVADKATATVPDHIAKFVDNVYPKKEPRPLAKAPTTVQAFIGDAAAAGRDYLGLTQTDIVTQLKAGKSLGDIANATTGKNRDGLVNAITAMTNAKIGKAQTDGKLTADQATQLMTAVPFAVATIVDHKGLANAAGTTNGFGQQKGQHGQNGASR
ncbi:MAG TPA: hypothetical protein VEP48_12505 [Methylomirabilota bacterium]|nr:hypothetical protein [Methylomirabilota bacterium]